MNPGPEISQLQISKILPGIQVRYKLKEHTVHTALKEMGAMLPPICLTGSSHGARRTMYHT